VRHFLATNAATRVPKKEKAESLRFGLFDRHVNELSNCRLNERLRLRIRFGSERSAKRETGPNHGVPSEK
jgi:hypothetical protein